MGIAIARALNDEGVILAGDINIVRTRNKHINSKFLSLLLNFPLKRQLASYAKGANILHIANSDIRKVRIIIPPLAEQERVVAEVEAQQRKAEEYRALADTMEQKIAQTITHIWEDKP